MAILFHGTTLWRAQRIEVSGFDPAFVEPGGISPAENFSLCLPFGPFGSTRTPEEYAWGKANAATQDGRDEGGPAILLVEIPDDIIALAVSPWFPLSAGFVQFDRGAGLEELLAAWPALPKRTIPFTEPAP
ncbi:MAG: hypothetical protein K2W96_19250 [Gemmataceae bacterium]|nr:hypothetical protein [Gemmataceae bacterium]